MKNDTQSPVVTKPSPLPVRPSASKRAELAKSVGATPAQLKEAKAMVADGETQALAAVLAELVKLRGLVPVELEKKPVTDKGLSLAISDLNSKADADLKEKNPKQAPAKNLAAFLGFIPELTEAQKAKWKSAKDTLESRYSAWHRGALKVRKAIFNRVASKPGSLIGTAASQRKDGTYSLVRLSVRQPRKAKPAKADAKPAQIAAKPAVPGNAGSPAAVS